MATEEISLKLNGTCTIAMQFKAILFQILNTETTRLWYENIRAAKHKKTNKKNKTFGKFINLAATMTKVKEHFEL